MTFSYNKKKELGLRGKDEGGKEVKKESGKTRWKVETSWLGIGWRRSREHLLLDGSQKRG